MTLITLAPILHATLVQLAALEDPPQLDPCFGAPESVARFEAIRVRDWARPADGSTDTAPPGYTARAYALVAGEVDVDPGIGKRIHDRGDCPPGLRVALAVLLELGAEPATLPVKERIIS